MTPRRGRGEKRDGVLLDEQNCADRPALEG
jgi:hypothetical protein